MTKYEFLMLSRRELLRLGGSGFLLAGAALHARPAHAQTFSQCAPPAGEDGNYGAGVGSEAVPLSPLILDAFEQDLPIPAPLAPVASLPCSKYSPNSRDEGSHQLYPGDANWPKTLSATPRFYKIALQVGRHRVTTGKVEYLAFGDGLFGSVNDLIDVDGNGTGRPVVRTGEITTLPFSAITGFSGTPDKPNSATFPGPMINAEYWKPNVVRFVNQLHLDGGMDLQDFGDPERGFLTHLHNGHTACESDGNPNDTHHQYCPGEWVDDLYHNYPAGGDSKEMQSFCWFHDHTHNHTGANVYKGMVGLYPFYDPAADSGDERKGYRLPGVRTNNANGSFSVKYDIPLALYDCLIDDGVTPHRDWHNGCGETHPEWKGKSFFRHYPNHGFVGDVFTVNGVAYPVLKVKRRKYRLRFLGASMARCYELMFMRKGPGQTIRAVPGLQGQYSFGRVAEDGRFERELGEQCFRPTQIASEGGLLPGPVERNSFEIWPANRKELILDFTKYMDGSPTRDGDEFFVANILKMKNGRKPNNTPTHRPVLPDGTVGPLQPDPEYDPRYCVPMLKIVIDGDELVSDNSVMPSWYTDLKGNLTGTLRPMPNMPTSFKGVIARHFALARSGGAIGEAEWIINGVPFDPLNVMARPKMGAGELWVLRNGSGGWVHPMHLHQEEHAVVARFPAGTVATNCSNLLTALKSAKRLPLAPDQPSKEDVADLGPNEEFVVYRRFRTFKGKYVAHCHNLAHEDHAMMFGFEIV